MSFHFCLFPTSSFACHTPLECPSPLPAPPPCTNAQMEVAFQPLWGFVDYIYHCPYAHIGLGKNSSGFFCNIIWKNPNELFGQPNTRIPCDKHIWTQKWNLQENWLDPKLWRDEMSDNWIIISLKFLLSFPLREVFPLETKIATIENFLQNCENFWRKFFSKIGSQDSFQT